MLNGNGKLVGGADKCPLCASEDIEWGLVELLDGPQLRAVAKGRTEDSCPKEKEAG